MITHRFRFKRDRNFYSVNFLAVLAALIAALSPDKILSAPIFLPFVGHPYFSCRLKMEQPESINPQIANRSIIFFMVTQNFQNKNLNYLFVYSTLSTPQPLNAYTIRRKINNYLIKRINKDKKT